MPHLHLSLQSGSDLILKRMKRRHGRTDAIKLCRNLLQRRPDMIFGADLIAGFPTETEAMFEETVALVEDCGLTHLHVFPFSARPGTPAAQMPPLDGGTIKARAQRLRGLGGQLLRRHLDSQIGRRLMVLVERGNRGHAEDFTLVKTVAMPGSLVEVTTKTHDGEALLA